jgi:hypothetical protein
MKKTILLLMLLGLGSLALAQMPVNVSATADATYAWTTSNTGYSVVVAGMGPADTAQGASAGTVGFTMVSLVNNSASTNLVLDETNIYGGVNGVPATGRVDFYLTQAVTFPSGVSTACQEVANDTKYASTPSTITAQCNQTGTGALVLTGSKVWMGVFQPGQTALKNWGCKLIVAPGWRLDVQVYPINGNTGLVTYMKWFEQPII